MPNKEMSQSENNNVRRTSGFIHVSEIIDDVMEDIAKRVLAAQRLNKKTSIHIEHHKKRHSIY
jgi:predicted RNA-binding protein with RPS1 domain